MHRIENKPNILVIFGNNKTNCDRWLEANTNIKNHYCQIIYGINDIDIKNVSCCNYVLAENYDLSKAYKYFRKIIQDDSDKWIEIVNNEFQRKIITDEELIRLNLDEEKITLKDLLESVRVDEQSDRVYEQLINVIKIAHEAIAILEQAKGRKKLKLAKKQVLCKLKSIVENMGLRSLRQNKNNHSMHSYVAVPRFLLTDEHAEMMSFLVETNPANEHNE